MTFSLNDSLQLVLPSLSPELVPPDAVPRIRKIAHKLPPVHQAGFESLLTATTSQIGFHQGFLAKEQSLETLAENITAHKLVRIDGWNRVYRFCTHLNQPPPLTILEFDIPGDTAAVPVPALFVALDNTHPWETSSEPLWSWTNDVIGLVRDEPSPPPVTANLHRGFRTCPEGARVMHVGIMLSRKADAFRINVDGLRKNQLRSYLGGLGWEGPTDDLISLWEELQRFVDRIALSLDIGHHVSPRVGLECYIDNRPSRRWAAFLDDLVSKGLCTSVKRDALLGWPGTIYPTSSDALWPGDLIVESLLQPPNRFSMFRRDLSHIKLVLEAHKNLSAKGYIRFHHTWAEVLSPKKKTNQRQTSKGA